MSYTRELNPPLSNTLSRLAVSICVLVFWPLTGRPIACRLPRYVPMSLSRLILSCTMRLASFSIVIVDNSAVREVMVLPGTDSSLA
jgi:hypothetical protein